jgi:lysozyme family protein
MAASSYDEALRRVLAHEGGYTNDPSDPGGPTNFGITIFDYRKYVKPGATAADVRAMKADEAKAIYRKRYWDALACDALPSGVDYAVFDYGVNSGVGRAGKVLCRCLGLPEDAAEAQTTAAAAAADCKKLIVAICDERLSFLRSLKTWGVFGRGWGARVAEVKAAALVMAAAQPAPARKSSNSAPHAAAVVTAAAGSTAAAAHASGLSSGALVMLVTVAASAGAVLIYLFACRKDDCMWENVKSWFKHSLTILWARIVAAAGVLLALADGVLADANVNAAIQQAMQPKYIPYYVIGIGVLTELARRRTVGRT